MACRLEASLTAIITRHTLLCVAMFENEFGLVLLELHILVKNEVFST